MQTNLPNSELLDDSVANSSSLKNRRMERTAQTAVNPNPVAEEEYENATGQEHGGKDEESYSPVNEEYKRPSDSSYGRTSQKSATKKADDDKILGMNKKLFYGLVVVGLGITSYLLYKKFLSGGAKGKANIPDLSKGATGAGASANAGTSAGATAGAGAGTSASPNPNIKV